MNALSAYGLLAHGLIFGALASLLPLGMLRPKAALTATAIALIAGIAPIMHAVFGTPSVTLLVLAVLHLPTRPLAPLGYRGALGLLAGAALFYPMALGWGSFDPYALGYRPLLLLGLLALAGAFLWWRRAHLWLAILAVDLAAYASGLFNNLWDVLFDPLLVLLAAGIVGRHHLHAFIAARRR